MFLSVLFGVCDTGAGDMNRSCVLCCGIGESVMCSVCVLLNELNESLPDMFVSQAGVMLTVWVSLSIVGRGQAMVGVPLPPTLTLLLASAVVSLV